MKQPTFIAPVRFPWYLRSILVCFGIGLLSLLATAAMLTPSSSGKGTHQQLGLPPCSFEMWFNSRCPSCGMTTSWSHMVRGQVVGSFQANSGGALLAIVAVVMAPWSLLSGVLGRWFAAPPDERVAVVVALTIVTVTLVDWGIRLSS